MNDHYSTKQPPLECRSARKLEASSAAPSTSSSDSASVVLFPLKLHKVLEDASAHGFDDIICWMPDGRSFKVLDNKRFANTVLPKYFSTNRKKSFVRQLNLWSFRRITTMPAYGAYEHPCFV